MNGQYASGRKNMDPLKPDIPSKNANHLLPVVESFFEKEPTTGVSILENLSDDQASAATTYKAVGCMP